MKEMSLRNYCYSKWCHLTICLFICNYVNNYFKLNYFKKFCVYQNNTEDAYWEKFY